MPRNNDKVKWAGYPRAHGEIVGSAEFDLPRPDEATWGELRLAYDVLNECAVVVSYLWTVESKDGRPESAEHYRRIYESAARPLAFLKQAAMGGDSLPLSALDDLLIGVSRLTRAAERIAGRRERVAAEDAAVLDVQRRTEAGEFDTPLERVQARIEARRDARVGADEWTRW